MKLRTSLLDHDFLGNYDDTVVISLTIPFFDFLHGQIEESIITYENNNSLPQLP